MEFWFTTIKVITIVGLIFLGLLLAMGAAAGPLLLGTDAQYSAVKCAQNVIGECLPSPGFNCVILFQMKTDIQIGGKPRSNPTSFREVQATL